MIRQTLIRRSVFALLSGLLIFLSCSISKAHVPILEDKDTVGFADAILIPRYDASYAVYANLSDAKDVDFYRVEMKKLLTLYIGLLVPYRDDYKDFYPTFALVGPGLSRPEEKLPFDLPEGYGALIVDSTRANPRPEFFEEFSRTRYYRNPADLEQKIDNPGTYYIVVWHPKGDYGSYVVGYGRAEVWRLKDIMRLPVQMEKIKSGAWIIKRAK